MIRKKKWKFCLLTSLTPSGLAIGAVFCAIVEGALGNASPLPDV